MLPYTLSEIYTQTVVIERDEAEPDEFGAVTKAEWLPVGETVCRLWWWKGSKSTAKSASNQYARPQATYDETGGDLALPLDTDVKVTDRLGAVTDVSTGEVIDEGPFRIVSLNRYEDHIELSLERP
jgi:hypothetical protein